MRRSKSCQSAFQSRGVYALHRALEVQFRPKARKSLASPMSNRRVRSSTADPVDFLQVRWGDPAEESFTP